MPKYEKKENFTWDNLKDSGWLDYPSNSFMKDVEKFKYNLDYSMVKIQ